jgi:phosphatidate cytidylyltransferase
MPLGMLAAVHALGGRGATLLLIGTVVVSDSAQYYAGRRFGRRPLAPAISPKKTVEGAIGGVVIGSLFMVVAGRWALPTAPPFALALVGGQLGAHPRARRRARPDRCAAVRRARLLPIPAGLT